MAIRDAERNREVSHGGKILAAIGAAALIADLAFLIGPVSRLAQSAHNGLIGIVPSIGMSILTAARAIAFHQVDYFAVVARILVLFSAMVAVIIGLVLTRTRTVGALPSRQAELPAAHEQENQ